MEKYLKTPPKKKKKKTQFSKCKNGDVIYQIINHVDISLYDNEEKKNIIDIKKRRNFILRYFYLVIILHVIIFD